MNLGSFDLDDFTMDDNFIDNFNDHFKSKSDNTNTNKVNTDMDNSNINKINVIKTSEPSKPVLIKPILKRLTYSTEKTQNKISYDDILNNMGLHIDGGELCSTTRVTQKEVKDNTIQNRVKIESSKSQQNIVNHSSSTVTPNINVNPENSYIYNKYFKHHTNASLPVQPILPKNIQEYRQIILKKLLEKRVQQLRIQKVKSTKLIMPNNNINISYRQTNNIPSNRFFRYKYFKTNERNFIYPLKK